MNKIFENDDYYATIYKKVLESANTNDNILFLEQYSYNPLTDFSHIIKKKNLKLYILSDNNFLENEIKEEECESYIYFINNYTTKKIYNIIILFHLHSIDLFNDFLNNIKNKSIIFIYSSLSTKNYNELYYKNFIRDRLNNFFDLKIGNVLNFTDLLDSIKTKINYKIKSLKIHKKNNYILYGDNLVYEIILEL
jgi:hypothetical protein